MTDIAVTNEGTVVSLDLLTPAAREWIEEHAVTEGWQWLGGTRLVVDPRSALPLLRGAHDAGLVIA